MNKKGLVGKIFLIIGIVILIIAGFIGITVYQVYSVMSTLNEQVPLIGQELDELENGACDKIGGIGVRIGLIKDKLDSACGNFLIRKALTKTQGVTVDCDNVGSIYEKFEESLDLNKRLCEIKQMNPTNMTDEDKQKLLDLMEDINEFNNSTA